MRLLKPMFRRTEKTFTKPMEEFNMAASILMLAATSPGDYSMRRTTGRFPAQRFLTTTHGQLEGQRPIDIALTELGARRVEELLWKLYHGKTLRLPFIRNPQLAAAPSGSARFQMTAYMLSLPCAYYRARHQRAGRRPAPWWR
jgi:Protein of unknown function (DUF2384)